MSAPEPTIASTIELIKALHVGQHDWTGAPYWTHPVAVMNLLPTWASEDDRMVALLHDVIEDCRDAISLKLDVRKHAVTIPLAGAFLRSLGYSSYVVRGVSLDTRMDGFFLHHATGEMVDGSYMDYIHNIIASGHVGAMLTKLADNKHNTDKDRTARLPPEVRVRAEDMARGRYARSIHAITQAIDALTPTDA